MSEIALVDISAWQGKAGIDFDIEKMWESEVRGVYMKAGQDDWVDRCFLHNYAAFRASAHPWKLGAYWFTTLFNALKQAAAFIDVTKDLTLDLPLCQDVEFYTASSLSSLFPNIKRYGMPRAVDDREVFPVLEYRMANPPRLMCVAPGLYGYSITNEATVDVIARKLAGQQGWAESAIYTNAYSGNTVFKTPRFNWNRLHLFDAYWSTTATKPLLPNIWKAADKWMLWQYGVDSGVPHGVPGSLDHDRWGNELPFPGEGPVEHTYQYNGYLADGRVICGEVKERC